MTLETILADIRARLNEVTAAFWTDAQLLVWINHRYQDLVTAVETTFENYFLTESATDLVEDQQEYSLPTDFKRMVRIEINYDMTNNATTFSKATPVTLDEVRIQIANTDLGSSGSPVYYIHGDLLGFLPIPDADGTSAVKIWYVAEQTDLSDDDDEPAIPSQYHRVISLGVCSDALMKGKRDLKGAAMFERMYQEERTKMQGELEDRIAEDVKMTVDLSGESLNFGVGG